MLRISDDHPLRRHFAGLVEHAFYAEVGMCDPRLTSYLAELLVSFTHVDYLNAVRRAQGKRLEQIATMLLILAEEKPATEAERDRAMYRQIGDYTLFWAGVFPEQLKEARHYPSDTLLDYVRQGKQSYAIVSDLATEADAPPSSLFRHLSEEFEVCLYGLGLVRREWENAGPDRDDPGGELVY